MHFTDRCAPARQAVPNQMKGTMDTINKHVMSEALMHVNIASVGLPFIHTVTITLNGATGGATVTIQGFSSDQLDEEVTIERQVR